MRLKRLMIFSAFIAAVFLAGGCGSKQVRLNSLGKSSPKSVRMESSMAADRMPSGLGRSERKIEAAMAPEGAVAAVPHSIGASGAEEPLSYSQTMDYNTAKGLQRIYFGFDDYTLRPDARQRLSENAEHIHNADSRFLVEGHADERGSAQYNLALGELRAKSAYQFLVDLGIDSEKMEYRTMGEEKPLNPGHNEEAWAKNRRAEFYALNGSEHVSSQSGARKRAQAQAQEQTMLSKQPAQLPTYHGFDQYITTNDSNVESVDLFYDRIGHPGLADIEIDWGEM